jgi:hypothetical protein
LLALAASTPKPPVNVQSDNLALRGYDAVAYFTDGRPTRGRPQFEFTRNGARWRFASKAVKAAAWPDVLNK